MIIILGNSDSHSGLIYDMLLAQGEQVLVLDTSYFPGDIRLSFSPQDMVKDGCLWVSPHYSSRPQGTRIALSSIKSVYWYCYMGVSRSIAPDSGYQLNPLAMGHTENFLLTFLKALANGTEALWVNPMESVMNHQLKQSQLHDMSRMGLKTPDTLMTNDPDMLRVFYDKHGGQVLSKSLSASGVPTRLSKGDLGDQTLAQLVHSPQCFQQIIKGTDIRVHVVDGALFPSELLAEGDVHYKVSRQLKIRPCSIGDELAGQSREICQHLGLKLAGLDFIRTEEGEYYFLEANPSPQFLVFDESQDGVVGKALTALLSRGPKT